jgi:predicted ATPase with chaperone activity
MSPSTSEGGIGLDLPWDGILAASESLRPDRLENILMIWRTSFDGHQITSKELCHCHYGKGNRIEGFITAEVNAKEAAVVEGAIFRSVKKYRQVTGFFNDVMKLDRTQVDIYQEF